MHGQLLEQLRVEEGLAKQDFSLMFDWSRTLTPLVLLVPVSYLFSRSGTASSLHPRLLMWRGQMTIGPVFRYHNLGSGLQIDSPKRKTTRPSKPPFLCWASGQAHNQRCANKSQTDGS